MANAGCINAYDCNGCLIQTLQNLDSACIGVGVQYTAPNPLDDKRLDYIKYTDKCGCVQCLSGENEILIYATDGVIKDLTLTNDDVNEAIKIQWNDIFGSNRAKTIVRYKTGSYPVSITDGTLAVEETTKNQYSSTPFSLSGVLDETTYYISAFAVDSNDTIINVQNSSITTEFFVQGYEKLNYIESTGTQYIHTGYYPDSSPKCEIVFSPLGNTSGNVWYCLFGERSTSTGTDYKQFCLYHYNSSPYYLTPNYGTFDPGTSSGVNISLGTNHTVINDKGQFYLDGTLKQSASTTVTLQQSNYSVYLFDNNIVGTRQNRGTKMRLYSCKFYNSDILQRDFVPAKRKSDSVVGLIDLVNKTFYTNSGTGTFNYG